MLVNPGNIFKKLLLMSKMGEKFTGSGLRKLSDSDTSKISSKGLKTYLTFTPAGTSLQSIDHIKQLYLHGEFKKYDYGTDENLKNYGQKEPPLYDLNKITNFPILLICGKTDLISCPIDYKRLRNELAYSKN